jgi:hypothetical protein
MIGRGPSLWRPFLWLISCISPGSSYSQRPQVRVGRSTLPVDMEDLPTRATFPRRRIARADSCGFPSMA